MTTVRLQTDDFHQRVAAGERPSAGLTIVAKFAVTQPADPQVVSFVFSDDSIDSYNDTIDARGWQWDTTGAGTIALFGHDATKVENVIGRAHNVRINGNQLVGDIHFAPKGVNPQADVVRQLVQGKFINSVSVGFLPLEYKAANDPSRPGGINFTKQRLMEISVVPLPANDNAITLARRAGIDVDRVTRGAAPARPEPTTLAARKASAAVAQAEFANDNQFGSLGEMLRSVFLFERDSIEDHRLVRAPTGASEGDPAGGGFLVPAVWAQQMLSQAYNDSTLAQLCTRWPTSNPLSEINFPGIDETSRQDGSRYGGVTSRWLGEGDSNTPILSFPRFKNLTFTPRKLLGACVVTDELIDDAPLLTAYINRAFGAEFGFRLDSAIFNGSGAGTPLGYLSSPCLVTVAKDAAQPAATISSTNVQNMFARLPAPSRRRAIFVVNEDAESVLSSLPPQIYVPAGDGGSEFGRLHGRPILAIEQAPALGTLGDITLIDPQHFLLIDGGTKPALSVHFRFDSDSSVFRFVLRTDGRPEYASPVTPFNGTITRSPFVALAAR